MGSEKLLDLIKFDDVKLSLHGPDKTIYYLSEIIKAIGLTLLCVKVLLSIINTNNIRLINLIDQNYQLLTQNYLLKLDRDKLRSALR